jgi:apolipoprotein N-acyltransferase
MHLYIPLSITSAAYLIKKLSIDSQLISLIIIAIFMSLSERVWPSIFEWNLAYSFLWMKWPLYHWADTVGFWGLSTWLFLFQSFIAWSIFNFKKQKIKSLKCIGATAIVIFVLTILGQMKAENWKNTDQKIRIGVAQGNIGNAEKIQSEQKSKFHSYIRGIYTELTDNLLKTMPADLVIWPETAMPFALDSYFHKASDQLSLLRSVSNWKVPVITGAYSLNLEKKDILGDSVIRNSVFYLSPNFGFTSQPYYKTNLLAFGEYMPFGETFPFLYKILPFVGIYSEGSGPIVAEVETNNGTVKLGPQICYDSLYPNFSRDLSRNGAQILFNVTNDSWFGWWAEPYQHQYMTLARAIEVRRPLVRSTNTGITSAILADGTILEKSPINTKWVWTYEINYIKSPELTIYTRFGHLDWLVWVLVLLVLALKFRHKTESLNTETSRSSANINSLPRSES